MKRDKIVTEEQRRKTAEMTVEYEGMSKNLTSEDLKQLESLIQVSVAKPLNNFKKEIIDLLDCKLGTSEKMIKNVYRHGIYIWVLAGLYVLNLIMLFLLWFKI